MSHCRPKLLQVGKSDYSVSLSLCQAPAGGMLFVLMRSKYCALISGALSAGVAVGCETLVRGQGVGCKLLTLRHPAPARRFALFLAQT